MPDLTGVQLDPVGFNQLAIVCAGDIKFPADYDAWLRLTSDAAGQAEPLQVNVHEFEKWARRVGVSPCLDALRAYVIIQRRRALAEEVTGDSAYYLCDSGFAPLRG
jgi:hypothetical protein